MYIACTVHLDLFLAASVSGGSVVLLPGHGVRFGKWDFVFVGRGAVRHVHLLAIHGASIGRGGAGVAILVVSASVGRIDFLSMQGASLGHINLLSMHDMTFDAVGSMSGERVSVCCVVLLSMRDVRTVRVCLVSVESLSGLHVDFAMIVVAIPLMTKYLPCTSTLNSYTPK